MVTAVGTPVVDYKLAVANQTQLLAQFQKSPSYSQAVSYYQANIGKVTSVDQLLGDRKLLTVALSAFQLESQINNTGILRNLLTQDPSQSTSLANQLIDPRFKAFAQAFSSLRQDGGATIHSGASINAVLAGYQTNEYEKWVSSNDNDPAVRQALYFQRTAQDTIDISSVGSLYASFQQSPSVTAATSYYKSNIGNVTSVDALINDPKLLDVALAASNIDPSSISTDTVRTLLTQDPTSPTSLAQQDPQYLKFAQTFSSLNSDGGASIQKASNVAAVISSYQTNQFAQAVATNDASSNTVLFGVSGAGQISTLFSDFQSRSGVAQGTSYYQANIGNVRTVDDLINDPQLLGVALSAYDIDPTTISTDTVRQLLTQNPSAPGSLAQQDPGYLPFAQAFSSLATDGGASIRSPSNVASALAAYQNNQFEQYVGAKLQTATATTTDATTGITTGYAGITIYQVLSDPTLQAVVQGALGLPAATAGLPVDQQIEAMTRAGFNISQLQDPSSMSNLVTRFLANAGLQSSANSDPSGLAALFSAGNSDGPVPIDLSFLITNVDSGDGSSNPAGSIVNLFA